VAEEHRWSRKCKAAGPFDEARPDLLCAVSSSVFIFAKSPCRFFFFFPFRKRKKQSKWLHTCSCNFQNVREMVIIVCRDRDVYVGPDSFRNMIDRSAVRNNNIYNDNKARWLEPWGADRERGWSHPSQKGCKADEFPSEIRTCTYLMQHETAAVNAQFLANTQGRTVTERDGTGHHPCTVPPIDRRVCGSRAGRWTEPRWNTPVHTD